MRRYRLPEALGGGEIEATEWWSGCAGANRGYRLAGTDITVGVPSHAPLEEVEPPLPPEPPVGSVVLDAAGRAWQNLGFESMAWCCAHENPDESWSNLATEYGPLALLLAPIGASGTTTNDYDERVIDAAGNLRDGRGTILRAAEDPLLEEEPWPTVQTPPVPTVNQPSRDEQTSTSPTRAESVTATSDDDGVQAECQHLRTDRDSIRCPDCDAELVYEIRGRCDDSD